MKEKIEALGIIIENLDTFRSLLIGVLKEPYGESPVINEIRLYRSETEKLTELFDSLELEYGNMKIKDLPSIE